MGSGFWADPGRLPGTRRAFCARVEGVLGLGELVEAELEERGQLACASLSCSSSPYSEQAAPQRQEGW
jgi:hypothetical protein